MVPVNTTHVKVTSNGDEPLSWAIRILPLTEAAAFTGEYLGTCSDVLYRFDDTPGLFVEITAREAERMGTNLEDGLEGSGGEDARFFLPCSGLISFASENNCPWSLRTAHF